MYDDQAAPPLTVAAAAQHSLFARAWNVVLAAWAAFIGALPHVLHHVGPLAGAAILAGAGGRALFAAIGFVLAIPFLRRIHRRFKTWLAPAIALGVMAVMFTISSFVIGPLISGGSDAGAKPQPGIEQPSEHEQHH